MIVHSIIADAKLHPCGQPDRQSGAGADRRRQRLVSRRLLGTRGQDINWSAAIVAGLLGSFVGGLLVSLLAGDGLELRPSGIIGSIVGAVLVTIGWNYWQGRQRKVS